MSDKPFMEQFQEAIESVRETDKKIRNSEFKILDFQSPMDNPVDRIKSTIDAEMTNQFNKLMGKTMSFYHKLFDKFVECSKMLTKIPDIYIDTTKVNIDDTRCPESIQVYTKFYQLRNGIPIEGSLTFHARVKLIEMAHDKPDINMTVCVGNPDNYPAWTNFNLSYGPNSIAALIPEQYEKEVTKALKKLGGLKKENNK